MRQFGDVIRRLPIIRHARWLIMAWRVEKHYRMWAQLGYHDMHRKHDDVILNRIWSGDL